MAEVAGIGVSSIREIKAQMVSSEACRFRNHFIALLVVGVGPPTDRAVSIAVKTTPMACWIFGSDAIRVIFPCH
jgi:hypothetical protein